VRDHSLHRGRYARRRLGILRLSLSSDRSGRGDGGDDGDRGNYEDRGKLQFSAARRSQSERILPLRSRPQPNFRRSIVCILARRIRPARPGSVFAVHARGPACQSPPSASPGRALRITFHARVRPRPVRRFS
jgi:hypothetical protein